jgi:hypothetical protein
MADEMDPMRENEEKGRTNEEDILDSADDQEFDDVDDDSETEDEDEDLEA